VFVEKPLAVTREELGALQQTSGAERIVTGFNRRWSPAALDIAPRLANRTHPLLQQMRINAGALAAGHWSDDAAQGGRLVGELCHFVDLACFFANQAVTQVVAAGAGLRAPTVEDTVQVLLTFADGSSAALSYFANGGKALPKERVELHWDGQSAVIDDFRGWKTFGASAADHGSRKQDKGHRRLLAEFVRFATDGGLSPVPFEQAAHVTELSFAVIEALETGQAVKPAATTWA